LTGFLRQIDGQLLRFIKPVEMAVMLKARWRRGIGVDGNNPSACFDKVAMHCLDNIGAFHHHFNRPKRMRLAFGTVVNLLAEATIEQSYG